MRCLENARSKKMCGAAQPQTAAPAMDMEIIANLLCQQARYQAKIRDLNAKRSGAFLTDHSGVDVFVYVENIPECLRNPTDSESGLGVVRIIEPSEMNPGPVGKHFPTRFEPLVSSQYDRGKHFLVDQCVAHPLTDEEVAALVFWHLFPRFT